MGDSLLESFAMIPVLTPEQMRQVDRETIERVGIPGIALMEHAGRALAEKARTMLRRNGSVGVVCGKGNNGGDGFVAARFLHTWGVSCRVYLVADPFTLTGDASIAFTAAQNAGVEMIPHPPSPEALATHALIVDCVLGTGTRGAVRESLATILEQMNATGVPILACDLPSGLDGETGHVEGACIRATETLTIGFPKTGLFFYPGAEYVGNLSVADIGFPPVALKICSPKRFLLERSDVTPWIPQRRRNVHKGNCGRVFLLCGSRGMTGAATLAAESALRVGAGLVTVGIPASLNPILEVKLTEAMTLPLEETPEGTLSLASEKQIRAFGNRCDVLGVGSGLSQNTETQTLVRRLLGTPEDLPKRWVLDADALNNVSPVAESRVRFPPNAILTPHPGEMARLLGVSVSDVEQNRLRIAEAFAQDQGVVVVLKGVPTVIASPDGQTFLNPTGHPGMATGGSGDVLTGVLTGLLAQGMKPLEAALLGVYLHGLAGERVAQSLGNALLPTDIIHALPSTLLELSGKELP